MKFISAVVILAFAVAVQSSVIPLVALNQLGGLQLSTINGIPWSLNGAILAPAIAPSAISIAPGSVSITGAGIAPGSLAITGSGTIDSPAAVQIIPASASYVAANRGTVHTAPLPGHSESALSLNLDAAPGTA